MAQNQTVSLDKHSLQAITALTREIKTANKIARRNQRPHTVQSALDGSTRITDVPTPPEEESSEGEAPKRISTPAEDPVKQSSSQGARVYVSPALDPGAQVSVRDLKNMQDITGALR